MSNDQTKDTREFLFREDTLDQTGEMPVVDYPQQVGRYQLGRHLGEGGMGRVVEAFDPELKRVVAVKLLRHTARPGDALQTQFVTEAQVTSQLEHPSIVPLHDFGVTEDGVCFYAMKKIDGLSLREILSALRRGEDEAEWSRHRLLSVFLRICDAVAYAHSRGVLHRDLKPENVMLGAFGEVLVLDWGIARVDAPNPGATHISTTDNRLGEQSAVGTPGYMSREQMLGEAIDERSDVWSLGALLYEMLALEPAYRESSIVGLLRAVDAGPPQDLRLRAPEKNIPEDLALLCQRALAAKPEDRFPTTSAFADVVRAHLEGSLRQARALEMVAKAVPLEQDAAAARSDARLLAEQAARHLASIESFAPEQEKLLAWEMEDASAQMLENAQRTELDFRQLLRSALNLCPELRAPHDHLAAHYQRLHALAEKEGRTVMAREYESHLRVHDGGQHTEYLAGTGVITLLTEPTAAEVELFRYEQVARKRVPRSLGVLGTTPLVDVPLEMGSYLLLLRAPGRHDVRYPVDIGRNQRWDTCPPGASKPQPIYLPRLGELDADECYVPAGWFQAGGDKLATAGFPARRYWVDGFALRRFPTTNREYIEYLDDLVARGLEGEALGQAPRANPGTLGEQGAILYGRDAHGRFVLRPDPDGDLWLPDWPVVMISWLDVQGYQERMRQHTGQAWRLPAELEWAKAARGVDGRAFPWGDHLDPSWTCLRASHADRPVLANVDSYPVDCSPYGVRGLGGNVSDWCQDTYADDPPEQPNDRTGPVEQQETYRVIRGGTWGGADARCASRHMHPSTGRAYSIGFRLARSLGPSLFS